MRLGVLAGCLATVASPAWTGCGSSDGGRTAAASDVLTIYTALPGHGPQAARARDVLDGERLALLHADGRAGSFTVRLQPLSDAPRPREHGDEPGWQPEATLAAAERAVADPGAIAYVGGFDAGATALALPATNAEGLLHVSPGATYGGFAGEAGSAPGEPEKYRPSGRATYGRIAASDAVQARAMADVLAEGTCRGVAILRAPNAFDDSLATLVERASLNRGLRVALDERVRNSDAESHGEIAQDVAASAADCAALVAGPSDAPAALLRALHEAAPSLQVVAPMGLADDAVARALGPAAAITRIVGPPPAPASLHDAFVRRLGREPGPWAAYGYEAMRRVLRAIEAAGDRGRDRQAVVSAYLRLAPAAQRLALWAPTSTGLRPEGVIELR